MKRHRGNLNAHYYMKEANLKRLHILGFQLYYILEKAKLWKQERISGYQGEEPGRKEQAEPRGFVGQ